MCKNISLDMDMYIIDMYKIFTIGHCNVFKITLSIFFETLSNDFFGESRTPPD